MGLLLKIMMMKQQIRHMTEQVKDLNCGKTEKILDISLIDRDLEQLAGVLNQYHTGQRHSVASARRHEENLKESIANISHDLRTPLTVILGHLQLLQKEELTPEQCDRIRILLRKAGHMKDLISNFYELSVLDAGQTILRMEKFSLSNLMMNLISENIPEMEKRNIKPEIILPKGSVFICSDPDMTERILQNLLSNAIRYSENEIRIVLSQKQGSEIRLLIENDVLNIESIDTERIFERFYTGDKSRHNESTGLGLSVVKCITEKLGGSVCAAKRGNLLSVSVVLFSKEQISGL